MKISTAETNWKIHNYVEINDAFVTNKEDIRRKIEREQQNQEQAIKKINKLKSMSFTKKNHELD